MWKGKLNYAKLFVARSENDCKLFLNEYEWIVEWTNSPESSGKLSNNAVSCMVFFALFHLKCIEIVMTRDNNTRKFIKLN